MLTKLLVSINKKKVYLNKKILGNLVMDNIKNINIANKTLEKNNLLIIKNSVIGIVINKKPYHNLLILLLAILIRILYNHPL